MFNFQISLFYNLLEFIESSAVHRKYCLLFQELDLSVIPDRNKGVGCTVILVELCFGHFLSSILKRSKRFHDSLTILKVIPPLPSSAVLTSEQACPMKASFIISSKPRTILCCNRFIIVSIKSQSKMALYRSTLLS